MGGRGTVVQLAQTGGRRWTLPLRGGGLSGGGLSGGGQRENRKVPYNLD